MSKEYELLTLLTKNLNNNKSLFIDIFNKGKEEFSKDENLVNVGIGIISETALITNRISNDFYVLIPKLYELIKPVITYNQNLLNKHHLVNSYKLYDFLLIDLQNLLNYLNEIIN